MARLMPRARPTRSSSRVFERDVPYYATQNPIVQRPVFQNIRFCAFQEFDAYPFLCLGDIVLLGPQSIVRPRS